MLVKELLKESNAKSINTHIGDNESSYLLGFFSASELIKWYGNCECKKEEYEDFEEDDGEVFCFTFKYIVIYTDKDYRDEILKERGKCD